MVRVCYCVQFFILFLLNLLIPIFPAPTNAPSKQPTKTPTIIPTKTPTKTPTIIPTTATPSFKPSTVTPTIIPTAIPTSNPTYKPSYYPSSYPTAVPTQEAAIQEISNVCPDHYFQVKVKVKCIEYPLTEWNESSIRVFVRNLVDYDLSYDTIDSLADESFTYVDVIAKPNYIQNALIVQDPTSLQYTNKLIGIALDGIPIYTSMIDFSINSLFSSFKIDGCGGMYGPTPDGVRYHYRVMPTCIIDYKGGLLKRKQYVNDIYELLDQYNTINSTEIIGYSLKGYPIYSPFDGRGRLHDNLDNCNGKYVNDKYGYYLSVNFPYIIGCDGPGIYDSLETLTTIENIPSIISKVNFKSCPAGFYPAFEFNANGCLPCPAGRYSVSSYSYDNNKVTNVNIRDVACNMICPIGSYCPIGSIAPIKCPSGRFGNIKGNKDDTCNGNCLPGYFCPVGSSNPKQNICGNSTFYCPSSSGIRLLVDETFYSAPLSISSTMRYQQFPCEPGSYCINGSKMLCPAGRYGNSYNLGTLNCTDSCPLGHYCEEGSILPTKCPAGTYGNSIGLMDNKCSGYCLPGFYCPEGSTSNIEKSCPGGRYGSEYGLMSEQCNNLCEPMGGPNTTSSFGGKYCSLNYCSAGYFCPPASTSPNEYECGNADVFCPPGSLYPIPVDSGYYSIGLKSTAGNMQSHIDITTRIAQIQCEYGYYCDKGIRFKCPAGRYGNNIGLTNNTCSGLCSKGFICNEGSPTSSENPCYYDASAYCPEGSYEAIKVPNGYYSDGGSITTRSQISICPVGTYCLNGMQIPCSAGRYASTEGNMSPDCEGLCDAGYYCEELSSSKTQYICPAGRYGIEGMTTSDCMGECLAGYYCPAGSTTPYQYECGDDNHYCPRGSGVPLSVRSGFYSFGQNSTIRVGESICDVGVYYGTPPESNQRENICVSTIN